MDTGRLRAMVSDSVHEWSQNANEGSGWARLLTPGFLWLGSLRRSFRQMIAGLAFIAVSPHLFPPSGRDNWMTRAVMGERLWNRHRPLDRNINLHTAGLAITGLSFLFGIFRRFWVSFWMLSVGVLLTAWHLDRMAQLYEREVIEADEKKWREEEKAMPDVEEVAV